MYIILDNGHGGIDPESGKYVTSGKRSPLWEDGTQLFEGVFNRQVVAELSKLLRCNNVKFESIVNTYKDVSLGSRASRVNKIYNKHKDAVLISIHANGFTKESANGFEVFTSRGETKSDSYARIIHEEYLKRIELKDRGVKESGFYILRKTNCPAVLIECGFMTNKKECDFLRTNTKEIAQAIYNGIAKFK